MTATTIGGIVSVLLVAAGLFYTNDANRNQQKLALQGQVADRFTAAIGQLGQEDEKKQDKLSIRLGGIYGLQRLMIDSPPDEPAVVQVLCAFVRTHAPRPTRRPKTVPPSPADVRAAVAVLARRPFWDGQVLDFSGTLLGLDHVLLPRANLTGADLTGADLTGADLTWADLTWADLTGADLTGAYLARSEMTYAHLASADLAYAHLTHADLTRAGLSDADLTDADLTDADLTDADLGGADLTGAYLGDTDLTGASLGGAYLGGADLSRALGLTSEQLAEAHVTATTLLPAGLGRPSPSPSR